MPPALPDPVHITAVTRRQFVATTASAAAVLPALLSSGTVGAQDQPAAGAADGTARQSFDQLYAALTKGAKPTEGKLTFEIPGIAENGNTVPFTVTADSPMTSADHVKAIHLLSTENPQPGIASFRFNPASGKAGVASRLRLAKTQDVVALAELSDGKLWIARTRIIVTIGGCGG